MLEKLARNIEGFNANSNNAINLTTEDLVGTYKEIAFFKELAQSDLISDRDRNSVLDVTPAKMTQIETVIPYLASRYGPFSSTREAFNAIGKSPEEFSMLFGQALADAIMADMLDTSFAALIGATQAIATEPMTVGAGAAGTATLSYDTMIDAMALYGDRLDEIACFVMRSGDYFGLMKGNITAATIDSVAGATLNAGSVATLGKPVLVMDSPSLVGSGAGADDSGAVLALTTNAITCIQSTDVYIHSETELLKDNIIMNIQGESSWGLDLKGFGYDKTADITRTDLAVGANWAQKVTSTKNLAGGLLLTLL